MRKRFRILESVGRIGLNRYILGAPSKQTHHLLTTFRAHLLTPANSSPAACCVRTGFARAEPSNQQATTLPAEV